MANKSYAEKLAKYIRDQQNKGYSLVSIRNFLLSRGYDKEQVNAAVDLLYGKKNKQFFLPCL